MAKRPKKTEELSTPVSTRNLNWVLDTTGWPDGVLSPEQTKLLRAIHRAAKPTEVLSPKEFKAFNDEVNAMVAALANDPDKNNVSSLQSAYDAISTRGTEAPERGGGPKVKKQKGQVSMPEMETKSGERIQVEPETRVGSVADNVRGGLITTMDLMGQMTKGSRSFAELAQMAGVTPQNATNPDELIDFMRQRFSGMPEKQVADAIGSIRKIYSMADSKNGLSKPQLDDELNSLTRRVDTLLEREKIRAAKAGTPEGTSQSASSTGGQPAGGQPAAASAADAAKAKLEFLKERLNAETAASMAKEKQKHDLRLETMQAGAKLKQETVAAKNIKTQLPGLNVMQLMATMGAETPDQLPVKLMEVVKRLGDPKEAVKNPSLIGITKILDKYTATDKGLNLDGLNKITDEDVGKIAEHFSTLADETTGRESMAAAEEKFRGSLKGAEWRAKMEPQLKGGMLPHGKALIKSIADTMKSKGTSNITADDVRETILRGGTEAVARGGNPEMDFRVPTKAAMADAMRAGAKEAGFKTGLMERMGTKGKLGVGVAVGALLSLLIRKMSNASDERTLRQAQLSVGNRSAGEMLEDMKAERALMRQELGNMQGMDPRILRELMKQPELAPGRVLIPGG